MSNAKTSSLSYFAAINWLQDENADVHFYHRNLQERITISVEGVGSVDRSDFIEAVEAIMELWKIKRGRI